MNDQAYIRRGILSLRKNRAYLTEQSKQPYISKLLKKRIVEWQRQIPTRNNQIVWQTKHEFALAESELTDEYIQIRDKVHQAKDEYRRSLTPIIVSSVDDEDQALQQDLENENVQPEQQPSPEPENVPIKNAVKNGRGGKRLGSGRPEIFKDAKSKVVKVTLAGWQWDYIDEQIDKGNFKSYADYFRTAHEGLVINSDTS